MSDVCARGGLFRLYFFHYLYLGGRPLNWLWISDECLTLLNDLKGRLNHNINNNSYHHVVHKVTRATDSLATPTRNFRGMLDTSSCKNWLMRSDIIYSVNLQILNTDWLRAVLI